MGDCVEMVQLGQTKGTPSQKTQQTSSQTFLRLPRGIKCPLPSCSCFSRSSCLSRTYGNDDKEKNKDNADASPCDPCWTMWKRKGKSKESGMKDSVHWDSVRWDSIRKDTIGKTKSRKDSVRKEKQKAPVMKDHDVCYKVLLIGDSGVGKTALVRALMGKDFLPKTLTTVGMDFVNTIVEVDGARIKLQIWDTAGQERFRSMTRFQFRGTQGAMLAYDITDRESFKTLKYWLQMIDNEIDQYSKEPVPVFLIGNKTDIPDRRQVPYKKGMQLAEQNLMRGFLETSAKTTKNVHQAFTQLAQAIVEINNPKLLDSYLDPLEKTEKYEQKQKEAEAIAQYQLQKQRSRIKLPSQLSTNKSIKRAQKCCTS